MRIRPPSSSWSWLNRSVFSSVAGYTETGMVTSPKLMAPFHIDLGMVYPSTRCAVPTSDAAETRFYALVRTCGRLGEDRAERVRREVPDAVRGHQDLVAELDAVVAADFAA